MCLYSLSCSKQREKGSNDWAISSGYRDTFSTPAPDLLFLISLSLLNLIFVTCRFRYGERVSQRVHAPKDINFALELGLKDVNLVLSSAADTVAEEGSPGGPVPMPLASLIQGKMMERVARGDGHLDWSSIGINASEDAGMPVDRNSIC